MVCVTSVTSLHAVLLGLTSVTSLHEVPLGGERLPQEPNSSPPHLLECQLVTNIDSAVSNPPSIIVKAIFMSLILKRNILASI